MIELQDSGPNTAFDHLTALLRSQCGTPFALVSFIHGDVVVFRSEPGLSGRSLPREISAANVLVGMGPGAQLVIEDAATHPVLKDHPMVIGAPFLRFFAGVTVSNGKGEPVGAVSVMDTEPRPAPSDAELANLHHMAGLAGSMWDQLVAQKVHAEEMALLALGEEMSRVGQWRFDIRSGDLVWSPEVWRVHGLTPGQIVPDLETVLASYHPEDATRLSAAVTRAIATGEGYALRLRLIRPNGEERLVETKAGTQQDETGQTVRVFGVFQDITEAVRSREAIAASEARYRLLADHASDIILTYGVDGRIRYVSPSVEAVSGMAPAALIGQPVTAMIHPEDVQRLTEAFRELVRRGGATGRVGLRYRGNLASGETRWFEARTTLIRDDAGRVVEFHDVVRDVTATKALEDELIAARDVAEAATRAKSEFLANMSHELRTPLTGVIGFAGLLQASAALPDAERHYADRVATASEALLSVINDILDYSKLEADAISLDSRAFDPAAMARGAAAIVEAQCGAKGLALRVETPDGLPAAILGDEARLRQVTLNLLSNAVKFTASGEIVLSVRRVNTRLRVTVTDSGIGIAAERIEALFERFAQADASTTRLYGGTGLGLAISRRLVEVMGGEIGVESRLGEGSSFWFEIPLVVAEQGPSTISGVHTALPPDLKVLLADDTPANRELVLLILTAIGIQPDPVCDGAEALKAAARGDYDLILMDVHMPVMDGLAATRAIRALPGPAAATPILALTASVLPEQIEACRRAGMDGHVGKPIKVEALINAMASALNAAAISDTASAA
ncbi:MAG: ATP-binding protein [Brevundimonas sp.]|uniref:ATP-binding protein n=1 Tax=Brevundimonas sp. TaxID=1871086 RepID=UPI0027357072|nr:ATP-binding protein [Brevundimonas sp.]MDP3403747.1 ATP-binding protein [Brevundimonas sp.]